MALRDDTRLATSGPEIELREDDRIAADLYDRDTGRSSFAAFLMGGVVVAGGLLAFLYYDSDTLDQQASRDMMTTGSIAQTASPAEAVVPSIRLSNPGK